MKFTNLTATVAMVALLCGAVVAHAQTMSGKGIDTSATNGYGAQLQLDEVKAQQVVNTTAISTQGEQLEEVNNQLGDIDQRLDNLEYRFESLEQRLDGLTQTITNLQSSVQNIVNEMSDSLDLPQCEGEGAYLQSDGTVLLCFKKAEPVWFNVGGTECNNAQCTSAGSPGIPSTADYLCQTHGYAKHVDVELYTRRTSMRVCTRGSKGNWGCDNSCSSCGPGIAKVSCEK